MISIFQENELLIRLKTGDEAAFRELYDYYWEEALLTAYSRLEDLAASQDLVQEVFVNIWKLRSTLHIANDFKAYLFGAIKLRVIGYFQAEKIKKKVLDNAMVRMQEMEASDYDLRIYHEMEKLVSETIDLFPENMKIAFLMRSDDRSISEIAKELNLAEQTVKNNISEGLKRLRLVLIKRYPEKSVKYIVILATLAGDHLTNS